MPKAKSSISLSNFIEPQSVPFAIRKSFAASREKLGIMRRITRHKQLLGPQQFICCMQSANYDRANHVTNVFYRRAGISTAPTAYACGRRALRVIRLVQARVQCRTEEKNKMRPQQGWGLAGCGREPRVRNSSRAFG